MRAEIGRPGDGAWAGVFLADSRGFALAGGQATLPVLGDAPAGLVFENLPAGWIPGVNTVRVDIDVRSGIETFKCCFFVLNCKLVKGTTPISMHQCIWRARL